MKSQLITAVVVTLLAYTAAHAIDAKYREQLERSGCTQLTELQVMADIAALAKLAKG